MNRESGTNYSSFGVEKNYCFWCDMKLHKSLFDDIYALNAVYPEYCPWCGKKINYKFK